MGSLDFKSSRRALIPSAVGSIPTRPRHFWPMTATAAYKYCEQIARNHYENFPVGSLFIPPKKRRHIYAIYAFARTADDFADEPQFANKRADFLENWHEKLSDCYAGRATHPVFIALHETISEFCLPQSLFNDLLTAFKIDISQNHYKTFDDLLFYCRHSANPIGRLILLLFNYRDPALHLLSDSICTGLQLANFWQDVAIDLEKERIYIPLQDMSAFGYSVESLQKKIFTSDLTRLMRFQIERTWKFFEAGQILPELVRRDLRFELRGIWIGGTTILHKIENHNYNIFIRPTLRKWDILKLLPKIFSLKALHR